MFLVRIFPNVGWRSWMAGALAALMLSVFVAPYAQAAGHSFQGGDVRPDSAGLLELRSEERGFFGDQEDHADAECCRETVCQIGAQRQISALPVPHVGVFRFSLSLASRAGVGFPPPCRPPIFASIS